MLAKIYSESRKETDYLDEVMHWKILSTLLLNEREDVKWIHLAQEVTTMGGKGTLVHIQM
jgi:hypothetical protein